MEKLYEDATDLFDKMFDEEGAMRGYEPDFPLGNLGDMPGESWVD